MLLTIDERESKIARNSVFDCHLSPVGRQMTIENSVSNYFLSTFVDSIFVFDCRLSGVVSLKEVSIVFKKENPPFMTLIITQAYVKFPPRR